MYAIVEIQGQQFKAEAGKKLYVNYLGENTKKATKSISKKFSLLMPTVTSKSVFLPLKEQKLFARSSLLS